MKKSYCGKERIYRRFQVVNATMSQVWLLRENCIMAIQSIRLEHDTPFVVDYPGVSLSYVALRSLLKSVSPLQHETCHIDD